MGLLSRSIPKEGAAHNRKATFGTPVPMRERSRKGRNASRPYDCWRYTLKGRHTDEEPKDTATKGMAERRSVQGMV